MTDDRFTAMARELVQQLLCGEDGARIARGEITHEAWLASAMRRVDADARRECAEIAEKERLIRAAKQGGRK